MRLASAGSHCSASHRDFLMRAVPGHPKQARTAAHRAEFCG